jgi:hypothetical protein
MLVRTPQITSLLWVQRDTPQAVELTRSQIVEKFKNY